MSKTRFFIIVVLVLISCSRTLSSDSDHKLVKRYLLFPRGTVLQFTYGLTVPLVLPRRSINLSTCMQVNYNLPYNVSNFQVKTISVRNKNEQHYFDLSRVKFYEYIMDFLNSIGLEGEECLLKSICEISEFPMHIEGDESLLEKIVHYVFTPSLEIDAISNNKSITDDSLSFNEKLILAEDIGRKNGDCEEEFSDCIISIVDLFTMKYIT